MAEQRARGRWILSCACKPRITLLCEFILAALARARRDPNKLTQLVKRRKGVSEAR